MTLPRVKTQYETAERLRYSISNVLGTWNGGKRPRRSRDMGVSRPEKVATFNAIYHFPTCTHTPYIHRIVSNYLVTIVLTTLYIIQSNVYAAALILVKL